MYQFLLESKAINNFIKRLNFDEEKKISLMEKIPSFTNEEKVFLWKTLLDIYQLEQEKEKAIQRIEKYFGK